MSGKARIYRRSKWVQDENHNWIEVNFWRIRHSSGAFEERTNVNDAFARAYTKTQEFYPNGRPEQHPVQFLAIPAGLPD